MIAEAIQALQVLFQKSQSAEVTVVPGMPKKVAVREPDGTFQMHDVPPPLRKPAVDGFDDLVHMLTDSEIARQAEVYIGEHTIQAFLDGHDRFEVVNVDMKPTKRWERAVQLESGGWKGQPRDAVKMLRFDFHSTNCQSVIDGLSRIDFTRHSAGKSHVQHGSESLGSSVEAAVQQADKVPEQFEITVPVWGARGFHRYSVPLQCGIFIDVHDQNVQVRVLADETQRALTQVRSALADDLREALGNDIRVFLGDPKHRLDAYDRPF